MTPIRVVLADDHTLVLEAFQTLLKDHVDVVGMAVDGRELIRVVRDTQPDVVVTDISMPGLNGVDACIKLSRYQSDIKVIFLTVCESPESVSRAFEAGAKGYILKNSASSELLQAIQTVSRGGEYITPAVAETLNGMEKSANGGSSEKLTVRQREILQLLAEGHSMKEAASILHLTPRTIAFHKYRIMESLGIENNAGLVRYAMEKELVS